MRAYLTVTAADRDAALQSEADALILDAAGSESAAPTTWLTRLEENRPRRAPLYLRLGDVESPDFARRLTAVAPLAFTTILLPVRHGSDVAHAGARLAVHEAEHGWPDRGTRIVALVADAAGAMSLASLAGASPRLAGIGWDAAALADDLGSDLADADGMWIPSLAQVRAQVRLAAAAAGVEAIETACPPGADAGRHAAEAQRDSFGAVFAQKPDEIRVIRAAALRPS